MTIWIIAGMVASLSLVVIARMARSPAVPAWHDAVRSDALRGVLAVRGLDARAAPKPPAGLPDLRLPLAWSWRTRAGAEGTAAGVRWLLYDTESRQRPPAGCNAARASSGDETIARHTVATALDSALALPRFTVLPNVRQRLAEQMPQRLREAGLGDSRMAGFVARAAGALTRLEEHGQAMRFRERPGFADTFSVAADDEAAVRPLFDARVVSLLERHPWAIVEGNGRCLAVSRNVAEAFATRQELGESGWLSVDSAGEVVALARELHALWRG